MSRTTHIALGLLLAGVLLAVALGPGRRWLRGSRNDGAAQSSDPYDPSPAPYLVRPPADPRLNQESDLLPQTVAALHDALDGLGIAWFISQGISRDPLSAGTHRPDGRRAGRAGSSGSGRVPPAGEFYTAVADISIRGLTTKTPPGSCSPRRRAAGRCLSPAENAQFVTLLRALRGAGFAAWYRHLYDSAHRRWEIEIHAIDPAAPYIKASLRRQMDDYLQGRDGLRGRRSYDAAGTIRPNPAAFCRRTALSAGVRGYVAFAADRAPYRSRTRVLVCAR